MSAITYYKQLTSADGSTFDWHERACNDDGSFSSDRIVDADQQPLLDWLAAGNTAEVRAYVPPVEVPEYDPELWFFHPSKSYDASIAEVCASRLAKLGYPPALCMSALAVVVRLQAKPQSEWTEQDVIEMNWAMQVGATQTQVAAEVNAKFPRPENAQ